MMAAGGGKNMDFYSVMGLQPDCNATELRNAYKKLAMRWHPDKWSALGNPKVAEECKKKFQAIQEAYSVLSDHSKRFLYDAGLYESDDDDDMGDFLGEMVGMMNESKSQMSGFESFEDLQDLFMEMFEGDLHMCNGMQRPKSPTISSSSKRNCSDFPKETMRVEEIGEGSFMRSFNVPSFCMGVSCEPQILLYVLQVCRNNGKFSVPRGFIRCGENLMRGTLECWVQTQGGSTQANGKGRRRNSRKHKAGHHEMPANIF